jgi:polyhydroxybutyrate depolymerase
MKLHRVLAALALLAFAFAAAAAAPPATHERTRASAHHAKKRHAKAPRRPHKLVRKPLPKAPVIAAAAPRTDTRTPITKPGDYAFAIQHDGRARTYRVHVPAGYTPADPAPLVIGLRAGDGDAAGGSDFYGLLQESDRQGFITVLPDVYRPRGQHVAVGWNAGRCCGAPNVNDVGFIETVVNNVFGQLSISRQHIYAAGMADGGMMAYRLACELPHVFTAVASVAGTDNTLACTPDKPVSVLHLHARNDRRMPFDGGVDPLGQAKVHITSAPQTATKWARLDGCMETPETVLQQDGASCQAYAYCRGQAEVRLCTTETGGHSWPGAVQRNGRDAPSQALSATQTIWSFFSAH